MKDIKNYKEQAKLKKNMQQFILYVLRVSEEEYQQIKFNNYFTWCKITSVSNSDLQQLMISQELYNWHKKQISLLEQEFVEKFSNSKTLTASNNELFEDWKKSMLRILQVYPRKILLKIRKDARSERFSNRFNLEYYNGKQLNLN
jgi:hypothetical protein